MKAARFTRLDTPRLRLRRFEDADVPRLLAYRNDPEVARYQSWDAMSAAEAEALVRDQASREPGLPGYWFPFAVSARSDGLLLGDCALCVNLHDPRLGEIGFTFARAAQGRGIAFEAVHAVLSYAFENLLLHRVRAVVDCENARAVRLAERLGMRREAHVRQREWFKGRWCDEYVFALLVEEWPALEGSAEL